MLTAIKKLMFGWKTASLPMPSPPSVEWLLQHRKDHICVRAKEVTPIASLYRMYEYIVVANNTGLRTEIEFFFNHPQWSVAAIPDPKDRDLQRYAILAVLPRFLVAAFNRLVERGLPRGSPAIIIDEDELSTQPVVLEEVPRWIFEVPKLEKKLVIPDLDSQEPKEEVLSPQFLEMNIVVSQPHVMFV